MAMMGPHTIIKPPRWRVIFQVNDLEGVRTAGIEPAEPWADLRFGVLVRAETEVAAVWYALRYAPSVLRPVLIEGCSAPLVEQVEPGGFTAADVGLEEEDNR